MKRKWLSVLLALVLIFALAVPAAAQGYYAYDYESGGGDLMTPLLVGVGVSGVICFGLVSLQKSVHKKTGASDYITGEGVHISHASDRFTHTTQTRRRLQNNQNNRK